MGVRESFLFLRQARERFHHTGAVLPSSAMLGKTLAASLPSRRPLRVLEVGAGTGSLTRAILPTLSPACTLDIVEINPEFATYVQEKILDPADGATASMILGDFLQVSLQPGYDAIVSGLPLNNFPVDTVRQILERAAGLLTSRGVFSWYEYLWIRHLKNLFIAPEMRRQLAEVEAVLHTFLNERNHTRSIVPWNVPPAIVHTVGAEQRTKNA